jgi:hypothetical protein
MLKSEKEKLDRKVRSLSWDLENKDSLIKALHEIADTFREFEDRRKGDYIERLYLRNKVSEKPEAKETEKDKPTEPEQKPPVQDEPKPAAPTPKPPVQDVPKPITPTHKPPVQNTPKPAEPEPKPPVHDTPKQDEPVQKPPEQTKSRGMKRR